MPGQPLHNMDLTKALYTISLLLLFQISAVHACSFGRVVGNPTETVPRVDMADKEIYFYQFHEQEPKTCGRLVLDDDRLILDFDIFSTVGIIRRDDSDLWSLVDSTKVVKDDLVLVILQREYLHCPLEHFQQPMCTGDLFAKLKEFFDAFNSVSGNWVGGFVIEPNHDEEAAGKTENVGAPTQDFERSRHNKRSRHEDFTEDEEHLRFKRMRQSHVGSIVQKDLQIGSFFQIGTEKLSVCNARPTGIQLEAVASWTQSCGQYKTQRSLQRRCACILEDNMANFSIQNGCWAVVFHGEGRTTTISYGDARDDVIRKRSIEVQKGDLILLAIPTTRQFDYDAFNKVFMILDENMPIIYHGLANPAECSLPQIFQKVADKIYSEIPEISGAVILIE